MEGGLLRGVQRHLLWLRPDAVAGRLGDISHPRLHVCWEGDICMNTEEWGSQNFIPHLHKWELELAP